MHAAKKQEHRSELDELSAHRPELSITTHGKASLGSLLRSSIADYGVYYFQSIRSHAAPSYLSEILLQHFARVFSRTPVKSAIR